MTMRIPFLPLLLGGILVASCDRSVAAPLPSACAIAHMGSLSALRTEATARDYDLRFFPSASSLSLHAAMVTVKGTDGSDQDLRDILDAASVVLLGALTNHHAADCGTAYFAAAVQPILAGLESGRGYDIAWMSPVVSVGTRRLRFATLRLRVNGGGGGADRPVAVSLDIHGAATNGDNALAALLPQDARSDFSMPARALGPLLAATAGRPAQSVAVPVTIGALTARRGDMRLDGSGSAVLTGNPDAASATGHMSMRNLPELIAALRAAGQARASAALILANLVGHHADADTSWDVTWQGGILTVNHIPLPVR